ncbi:endonuclease III domain-containing protein [Planctomycetota bacterium]
MKADDVAAVIRILKQEYAGLREPIVTRMSRRRDPFKVLVSTVISARTKDDVTGMASKRLYEAAGTPGTMMKLSEARIAKLIYPAGFYKTKAKHIRKLCRALVKNHEGTVPPDMDSLLALPGVGRKTANLVLGLGFGIASVCVDTHVHRISNRLGYVRTKTPEKTEIALRKKLPKRYWIEYNSLLVAYGQSVCKPIGPRCGECRLRRFCGYGKKQAD